MDDWRGDFGRVR